MTTPDIILFADRGDRAFAINMWANGDVSKPEPGRASELKETIRHFMQHGYGSFLWAKHPSVRVQYVVRDGFDVSQAAELVKTFINKERANV